MKKNCLCQTAIIAVLTTLLSCQKTTEIETHQSDSSLSHDDLTATFDTASLSRGLIAYFPFTGNANDSSGNGHNGVARNATLTMDRNGISNSAYYFNGNSSYIKVPNHKDLNLTGSFSISSWFNLKSYATNYNASILLF